LDREVVEAVIVAKDGRVGVCIDICLEMSSGIQAAGDHEPVRSEESPPAITANDEVDLLGLEGQDGVEGINIEDRGGRVAERHAEPIDLME
jgi:CUE domain